MGTGRKARMTLALMGLLSLPYGSAVRAQVGSPGTLAQQPGLVPGRGGASLPPGGSFRLALYCADLFAATPDYRTRMIPSGEQGWVRGADGEAIPLREAVAADAIRIRGLGPMDAPRADRRAAFDVIVTNVSARPLQVEFPAGLLLVPAGQPAPVLPAAFTAAVTTPRSASRLEGETPAYAVWATRGFTRTDVEQTLMRRVSSQESRQLQAWLDAAGVPQQFDRQADGYEPLYRDHSERLPSPTPFHGAATLASGERVAVQGRRSADGRAVVTIESTKSGTAWRYAAVVDRERDGKLGLSLRHLKTGAPIEANGGRVWIALR